MGLYDREYYREDYARRERWLVGPITLALTVALVAPFFLQLALVNTAEYGSVGDPLLLHGGLSADKVLDGEVWRLVTSLFLHHTLFSNVWLLAASTIVLVYCGRNVEGTYGPKEMFWFYVVTAAVTQVAFFAVCVAQPFHFHPPEYAYGAAGPIAAVMVLFALHSPNSKVPMFYTSVRAGTLAPVIVLANMGLFFSTRGNYFNAVPVLVGAAFALLYHEAGWRVSNWVPDLPGLRKAPRRSPVKSRPLFQDSNRETPRPMPLPPTPPSPQPAATTPTEHLEAQLDRVLGKVARSGKESLTPTEHDILMRASEIYKSRRK